ncbi:MAG: hypothetical protein INR64_09465 [Caulobacteraceae bacterium]|nr:hypothetical protein [Caulobacter sp.]
MTTEASDAADALAAMHASQTRLARAAACPPERHLVFAAMMAAYVACPAAPIVAMLAIDAALLVGVALVIRWDQRRTGMFVNAYRSGRTRRVMAVLLPCMLALYALSYWLAKMRGITWAPLALAAPAALLAYLGSAWWQRVFVRELEARR